MEEEDKPTEETKEPEKPKEGFIGDEPN